MKKLKRKVRWDRVLAIGILLLAFNYLLYLITIYHKWPDILEFIVDITIVFAIVWAIFKLALKDIPHGKRG